MVPIDLGLPPIGSFAEGQRQLNICNSCRYCAGYCPVWPALERRVDLTPADVTHLANLCHDCRDCYLACMYTPPHEFAINPPQLFSQIRSQTYERFVWSARRPPWLRGQAGVGAAFVAVGALLVALNMLTAGGVGLGGQVASPYDVIRDWVLIGIALAPAVFAVVVLIAAALKYWRFTHGAVRDLLDLRAWISALAQAATLRHQSGTDEGCAYPGESPSQRRRTFHHLVVYGFGLTLLATTAAAIEQHIFGICPPYPYLSVPVLCGTVGGAMQVLGCVGLMVLKGRSERQQTTRTMRRADYGFLWALIVLNTTGLLVLAARGMVIFGAVLVIHLAAVLVAFAIAPYTKFVHWVFRLLAVYQNALEIGATGGAKHARSVRTRWIDTPRRRRRRR